MPNPVALITGACPGIGLALAHHLFETGWHLVMLDLQVPPAEVVLPEHSTLYLKADVSLWSRQADAFAQAFAWRMRLDLAALNAGIDDRDDIFNSINISQQPRKPKSLTFEVNLIGVDYGIKLFAHYASRSPKPGGQITITSSGAGIYGSPPMPQYAATKAGVIALGRSLAPSAVQHNITINVICPMMVETPLPPQAFFDVFCKNQITPMETVLQGFGQLIDPEGTLNGQVFEVGPTGIVQIDFMKQESSSVHLDSGFQRKFMEVFIDRNVNYAAEDV
ncbi:hypothetical protein BJY01DRAFT_29167 [Aspergillus pseudoustus]|uniref:NAD(P)-binding protein n=1 Tax=Aspergillus pseudoustus TaxID=1810923 RepID=A0ABR4JGD3_9EURO